MTHWVKDNFVIYDMTTVTKKKSSLGYLIDCLKEIYLNSNNQSISPFRIPFPLPTWSCVCLQPAVAVGNVGQLAVDLLVSTLNMSRVGYMHTDCLIPMAGNNPYGTCKQDAEELHTPAEGWPSSYSSVARSSGSDIQQSLSSCFVLNNVVHSLHISRPKVGSSSNQGTSHPGKV